MKKINKKELQKRKKDIEKMIKHFDELPYELQIDFSARADMAVDLFTPRQTA